MSESDFIRDSIESARKIALSMFAGRSDRETIATEAMSYAWQGAVNAGPRATPGTVGYRAALRAGSRRASGLSVRSIDHPRNQDAHPRTSMENVEVGSKGDDPATIAQVRIDFAAWLETLNPRQRTVVSLMLCGYSTREIASVANVSAARISQLRREFFESWQDFTS